MKPIFQESSDLSPGFIYSRWFGNIGVCTHAIVLFDVIELKGWGLGMKGDWQAALPYFAEVHRLTNHPLKGLLPLGVAYAQLGMRDEALDVIRKMEQRQLEEPEVVVDADLAGVWFALGNLDKTFYHLNRCADLRVGPISYFLEYPAYKGIKKDPRYNELKKRLKVD